jgi:regulator of replication initiation timing
MRKRKPSHAQARRDLQLEVGRLQQENQDLRAENQRLSLLLVDLNQRLSERVQEPSRHQDREETPS